MAAELSHDLIYEAVLDDGAFDVLPGALASAAGARSALLHWRHHNGASEVLGHNGYFRQEQMDAYVSQYVRHDLWLKVGIEQNRQNEMVGLDVLMAEDTFANSIMYNDFIRGMGDDTFRCMGAIFDTPYGMGGIGIHRGRSQESFAPDTVSELGRFTAALRRMMTIRGELATARTNTQAARSSFDSLALAILQVDSEGRLLDGNALAEELLQGDGALRLVNGQVRADAAFKKAVALATDRATPEASLLTLQSGDGPALSVTISPLPMPGMKARAMIVIKPPFATQPDLDRRLMQLFGLSQAEARISIGLAEGLSPADIADRRHVSEGTVRIQLKTIMAKLGCRRQTQIAAAVLSLPPLRLA